MNGAALRAGVSWASLILAQMAFTPASSVGEGTPASRWASAMATIRRLMVEVLATRPRWAT